MKANGTIEKIRIYPSPNPHIVLREITYWSCGLRVKGMLASPKEVGSYEGILYCRGGMQSIGMVRPARIAQIASEGFIVFAPYYRGNRGGEGKDEFAGEDRMGCYLRSRYTKAILPSRSDSSICFFTWWNYGIMDCYFT